MNKPILEVSDLHVGYGKVEALHGARYSCAACLWYLLRSCGDVFWQEIVRL